VPGKKRIKLVFPASLITRRFSLNSGMRTDAVYYMFSLFRLLRLREGLLP
jgi:hypothetical protein